MPMISVAPPPALAFPRLTTLTMPPPMIALPDRAHADAPRPPPPLVVRHAAAKHKAVVVMGATGTGKSRLAIDLALRFGGEVINSDKIQVYAGLPVITNKVTDEECAGVPHHLLGCVPCPDADFTVDDFCREATDAIKRVLSNGGLPVVAGGSNRYVEALVEGDGGAFRSSHDCLFVWLDAAPEVLRRSTAVRVDDMVRRGLVEEARAAFDPDASYTRGVRRAIGLPEMDAYLRRASDGDDDGGLPSPCRGGRCRGEGEGEAGDRRWGGRRGGGRRRHGMEEHGGEIERNKRGSQCLGMRG